MRKLRVYLAAAGCWFASTSVAWAQHASDDEYSYGFDDDLLEAPGLMPQAGRIEVMRRVPRVTLIRPRGSFVPELLKSVEQL